MKWVQTYESFTFRSPKKYYVLYRDDIGSLGGATDTDLNKKMNSMLIHELFDEIVILDNMTPKEVKDWTKTIISGDWIFCHTTKPVFEKTREKSVIIYDALIDRKDIYFFMDLDTYNSKVHFHKLYGDAYFLPKTVFTKEDAYDLNYPIVCKPDDRSCGRGIEKFNSKEELKRSKAKFDVYSEYIDNIREFRALILDGKVFYIAERINMFKNKHNIDTKSAEDRVKFVYVPQKVKEFPYLRKIQNVEKRLSEKLKVKQRIYSIDFFLTPDEDIKVIECNSRSQLGPYELLLIYSNIMEVPYHLSKLIDQVIYSYLKSEKKAYAKEIKKSLIPIDYDYEEPDKSFLKDVDLYDTNQLLKAKRYFNE